MTLEPSALIIIIKERGINNVTPCSSRVPKQGPMHGAPGPSNLPAYTYIHPIRTVHTVHMYILTYGYSVYQRGYSFVSTALTEPNSFNYDIREPFVDKVRNTNNLKYILLLLFDIECCCCGQRNWEILCMYLFVNENVSHVSLI